MNQDNDNLSSLSSEQCVIGSMVIDGTRFDEISEKLTVNDFYYQHHKNIFTAADSLSKKNQAIDIITLAEKLAELFGDDQLGYMSELSANTPSSSNLSAYSAIVNDKAIKRGVLTALRSSQEKITDNPRLTAQEAIEVAQSAVITLSDKQVEELDVSHIDTALKNLIHNMEKRWKDGDKLDGLSSGLNAIDERIKGWKPGNLIIIAGRPGMGKTTYALQVALDMWTNQGLNGLFFSCEMSTAELMEKSMACVAHLPLGLIQQPSNYFFEHHSSALEVGASKLKGKSGYIIDCPGIHINQLKSYARKAHKRKKLDFLMVDHINIMNGDGNSPNHVVGSITGGLKHLAKELKIPVFGLAQLNRSVESRPNKRPLISDLRESGSMEQDADIVQLLFREDYYKEDGTGSKPNDGLLEINTAKFRGGLRGTNYFDHHLDQSRLEDTKRMAVFEQPKTQSRGF